MQLIGPTVSGEHIATLQSQWGGAMRSTNTNVQPQCQNMKQDTPIWAEGGPSKAAPFIKGSPVPRTAQAPPLCTG